MQSLRAVARRAAAGKPLYVEPHVKKAAPKKPGRPRTKVWPERACRQCGTAYQGRNRAFCSDACQTAHIDADLGAVVDIIRPFVASRSYKQLADLVKAKTGKLPNTTKISRAIKLVRERAVAERLEAEKAADELLAAERARCNALRRQALGEASRPARPEASPRVIPRVGRRTTSGLIVTLAATSLPKVTDDEVRYASACWHGYERGLRLAPEPEKKASKKRKAPSTLVQRTGPEV
jgi:hypothetical protein